jgi:hypothetical protein
MREPEAAVFSGRATGASTLELVGINDRVMPSATVDSVLPLVRTHIDLVRSAPCLDPVGTITRVDQVEIWATDDVIIATSPYQQRPPEQSAAVEGVVSTTSCDKPFHGNLAQDVDQIRTPASSDPKFGFRIWQQEIDVLVSGTSVPFQSAPVFSFHVAEMIWLGSPSNVEFTRPLQVISISDEESISGVAPGAKEPPERLISIHMKP